MTDRPGHVAYIDLLKIVAVFAVILVHASGGYVRNLPLGSAGWWAANLMGGAARFCVPAFVMASGALLLDPARNEPLGVFLRRRVRRVAVPFFAWAVIYHAWFLARSGDPFHLGGFLVDLLAGGRTAHLPIHLWFLLMILGVYLAAPVLKAFTDTASEGRMRYFLALWLLLAGVAPLATKLWGLQVGFYNVVFTAYAGYFVLGHYLHRAPAMAGPAAIGGAAALYGLAVAVTCWGTAALGPGPDGVNKALYGYATPNVALMAVAVFVLCRAAAGLRRPRWMPALAGPAREVGACVLGIYLVHLIVLAVAHTAWRKAGLPDGVVSVPGLAVMTFFGSLAIVWGLRRVPLVRHIVT